MFFNSTNKGKLPHNKKKDSRETIKLLTNLRMASYPVSEMRKINVDPVIKKNIKDLCLELGSQFIKIELETEGNEARFLMEKDRFNSILQLMFQSSNFFNFIHYASDLLQFYTLSCQGEKETQNLRTLDTFIASKAPILGDMNNNLFIIEYLVIVGYNNLVAIQEAFKAGFFDGKAEELNILLTRMGEIKTKVEEKIKNFPDNVFTYYLGLVINYSCAKMGETLHQADMSSSKEEKVSLSDIQKSYLKLAASHLDSIKKIQEFTDSVGKPYVPGIQFSFGRTLLRKLPSDNLKLLIEHVTQLINCSMS